MSDTINDPELYERMNAGHPSITAARKALKDFTDEVQQLREKYVIRDMVLGAGAIANVEGERLYLSSSGYRGNLISSLRAIQQLVDEMPFE